jgi:hypothetical protein
VNRLDPFVLPGRRATSVAARGGARPLRLLLVIVLAAAGWLSTGVGPAAGAALPGPTAPLCSWLYHPTVTTNNTAFLDTDASYWSMTYQVQAGLSIVLHGDFEAARYESLTIYGKDTAPFTANGVFSSVTDFQIAPDGGSVNPWREPAAAGGRYTLTLSADASPSIPNSLPVAPTGAAMGSTGWLFLRVYRPAGGDAAVRPPTVTFQRNGKSVTPPGCRKFPAVQSAARQTQPALAKLPTVTAKVTPKVTGVVKQFAKGPAGIGAGFANVDNGYLMATVQKPTGSNVVVMRGKAPTTPVGDHPSPWPSGDQVRFWSLCVYTPLPFWSVVTNKVGRQTDLGCRYDGVTARDAAGYYTYVLGTEAQRAAIEAIPGATFVPFSAQLGWLNHVLVVRNLLPDFDQAVQSAPSDSNPASAAAAMGEYYPQLAVCSLATLAAGGPTACIATGVSPATP